MIGTTRPMVLLLGFAAALIVPEPCTCADQPDTERIKLTVELPRQPLTLGQVNAGMPVCALIIENTGKGTDTYPIWPYLSLLKVRDAQGIELQPTKFIGRWGMVKTSILEEIKFITLMPGDKHRFEITLPNYPHDPLVLTGWKLPVAGKYMLILHYEYDRPQVKMTLGKGAKGQDDPKKPWNNAYQYNKKFGIEFEVKP